MNDRKFSLKAEHVLRCAQAAAGELGHGYVGCEHLLLAMLREEDDAACRALNASGIYESAVRERMIEKLGRGTAERSTVQGLTPHARCAVELAVGEALQCPTILNNGFGGHRIEGIGDKHIPWIHNVKNTDMAIAIDDEDSQRLLRLFNTPEGQKYMKDELGMSDEEVQKMTWLGISGIANVLCCIKMAKYYELTENDVVATVLTDSAVMYGSRIEELNQMHGAYNAHEAALDHNLHMLGLKTDSMLELTYTERKRVHNLKYYTWVEQQQMDVEDLNAQWYDTKGTWDAVHAQAKDLDELINEFNEATGLLKAL